MTKQLTEGNPFKLILGFSVPVLLGYLFQQFYNVTDTIIVSKTLGVQSLAAVGSTGAVNFLIIGFVSGLCSGFSIPVAQKFGAKDFSTMRSLMSNIVYLSIFFSVLMAVLTVVFCKPLLLLMQTPYDIVDGAAKYIRIIFAGIPVIFLYNITAGILRAMGDSRTPVFFLVLSSVLNISMDIVFIKIFGWGIEGAALATVIAQGIAGAACLVFMKSRFDILRAAKEEKVFSLHHCGTLCKVGIPMGLQYSITAIGSVILQTSINTLGSSAVAACTAAQRLSAFFCSVFDALGTTMATFGGQNTGAGKTERLGEGVRDSMIIGSVYSLIIFVLYFFAGQYLLVLFIDSSMPEVIRMAKIYLLENASAYILLAGVNIIRFMIQGMGFSMFAILSGVFEMIARTLMGIFMVPVFGFNSAGLASPLAWILADLFLVPAFIVCRKRVEKMMGK